MDIEYYHFNKFNVQTEGSDDGLNSTEVVITDLGDIGDDAIVVLEEAVGVGAEEVHTQSLIIRCKVLLLFGLKWFE